jgi:hypothetical protein
MSIVVLGFDLILLSDTSRELCSKQYTHLSKRFDAKFKNCNLFLKVLYIIIKLKLSTCLDKYKWGKGLLFDYFLVIFVAFLSTGLLMCVGV